MVDTVVEEPEVESENETVENEEISKDRLTSHIDRYYLGGNVEHVKLQIQDGTLNCNFISNDQSLVGKFEVEDMPLEDCELGIYDTAKLRKLIKILEGEIDIEVEYAAEKAKALHMRDNFKEVDFQLGELSIIPDAPSLKQIPDFETVVTLDNQFISDFIDAEKALKDSSTFAVQSDSDEVEVILGYSQRGNTNKVFLNPTTERFEEMDPTMFDSSVFSEILSANEDAEEMSWEVSSQGLSRIEFSGGDFDLTYYFVAKSEAV